MRRHTIRAALITAALTLLLLLGVGIVVLYSGAYNVAATAEHTALTSWVLDTGQRRSVAARAGEVPPPPPLDSGMVAHGLDHFRAMCVVCHGAPGVERGEFGQGMTPTPPPLSAAAAEFSTAELFWIVKHGIKMAGMPAFGPTHSDEEIWGIVAFLERLEETDSAAYEAMVAPLAAADSTGDGGGGHSHAPGTAAHGH